VNTLTRRLVIGFGGAFTLLTLVSFVFLYFVLSTYLRTQRAQILKDRVDAVASLLKSPAHGLSELEERIVHEWPDRGGERVYIQCRDANGQVIVQSPRLPAALAEVFSHGESGELQPGYLLHVGRYDTAVEVPGPVLVHAAIAGDQTESFLAVLREIFAGGAVLTLLMSLLVGRTLVQREMRPLAQMVDQMARIDSENLNSRIELEALPRELASLTSAINHTLQRLAESFERLSRFSSDLAHELRTPLANMMGELEVALARDRSEEGYREVLTSNLEECARLQAIVDSLLFLARAHNAQTPLHRQDLNLQNALSEMVEFYEPLASERAIRLSLAATDATLSAEPALFQRALGNLLANAIQYTAPGGKIDVSVEVRGGSCAVHVVDSGVGIGPEHLPHIFDRFYRVDASRTMSSGGTGLGLSIVKTVMDLHGGRVLVDSALGVGSRFTLAFY
jgi:two-component system heavy metal sensor histidine kinase CusS